MNRSSILVFIVILTLFFAFISQAILSIKLLELRVQLSKSQIMNYEFSSTVLKKKFKQMTLDYENITEEISNSSLESSVLNFDLQENNANIGFNEAIGLAIVNVVRKLSLKSFLKLVDDQNNLLNLQYAFYMERNNRCKIASRKYEELEAALHEKDDLSFVLLHNGFCLGILGERKTALVKLRKVLKTSPGTHFAITANILIQLLLDSEKRVKKIQESVVSENQKAYAFFKAGQCKEALDIINKLEKVSQKELYIRAKCNEKFGNTKKAVEDYVKLSTDTKNKEVAKKANRRLLVMGNLYEAGPEVKKFAEKQAIKLKDKEVVKQVKEAADVKLKSIVVEKIVKEQEKKEEKEKANEVVKNEESKKKETLKEKKEEKKYNNLVENLQDEIKKEFPTVLIETKKEIQKEKQVAKKEEEEKKEKQVALTKTEEKKKEEKEPPKKEEKKEKQVALTKTEEKKKTEKKVTKGKSTIPQSLIIILTDGRKIEGVQITKNSTNLEVKSENFAISIPYLMIKNINLKNKNKSTDPDSKITNMNVKISSDEINEVTSIERKVDLLEITSKNKKESYPLEELKSVQLNL